MKVLDKAGRELVEGARVRSYGDHFDRQWKVEMFASDGVQVYEDETRLRVLHPIRRLIRRPFTYRCNDLELLRDKGMENFSDRSESQEKPSINAHTDLSTEQGGGIRG